jgi:hypothetical protein
LTELQVANDVDIVVFDDKDETHQRLRERMESAGKQPSFPAAELVPEELQTGTDELIAHFASGIERDPSNLPLVRYYTEGVFKGYGELYRELLDLRAAQTA